MLILTCLLSTTIAAPVPDEGRLERYERVHPAMGSTFEIVIYSPDEQTAQVGIDAAIARIEQLNQVFSDYESDSEASQLSRMAPMDRPVRVSSDMWSVLQWSQKLSESSGGAFDVSVGPVTRLWRRARRQKRMPSEDRLQQALDAVGREHVHLDDTSKTVRLSAGGMRLDFGGVAKGYAADQALESLRAAGITRGLVNAGGDMVLGDPPPDRSGWRVGVAPLDPQQPPRQILVLSNCAVATSGDAWQFVEIDGIRYSHIVDPRTGLGVTQRSSVTVVARDGLTADGLASAVSVLGPTKGLQLVDGICGAACRVVWLEDDEVKTLHTSRFPSRNQLGSGANAKAD
jgi:thiamine biosynthesis lipoprotein